MRTREDKRKAHIGAWSSETMRLSNLLKGNDYLIEVYSEIVVKTKNIQDFKENRFIKFDINNN